MPCAPSRSRSPRFYSCSLDAGLQTVDVIVAVTIVVVAIIVMLILMGFRA